MKIDPVFFWVLFCFFRVKTVFSPKLGIDAFWEHVCVFD